MQYDPADYLANEHPRNAVYWIGGGVSDSVRFRWSEGENSRLYICAEKSEIIPFTSLPLEKRISSFDALIALIRLGETFKDVHSHIALYRDLQNKHLGERDYFLSKCKELDKVSEFVKQFGLPYLDGARAASAPLPYCCLVTDIVIAACNLRTLWTLWARMQELGTSSTDKEEREKLQTTINSSIENNSKWFFEIAGVSPFPTPTFTHIIHFNEATGKYSDRYMCRNLLQITFDQLYSFIADYDAGKYATIKRCAVCARSFIPEGRQKYCSSCRARGAHDNSTARSRKYREKNPEKYKRDKMQAAIKRKHIRVEQGVMSEDDFQTWLTKYLQKHSSKT